MNLYVGKDLARFKALNDREDSAYYKNLVFRILEKMSQIEINDQSGYFHMDITYIHFRYFGDYRTFQFKAKNTADAYYQYLSINGDNDLDLNIYINYELEDAIQSTYLLIERSRVSHVDILKFDNLVAFLCLEEILSRFIDEWEPSIYIQKDSRIPVKCIGYSTTGLYLSEEEETAQQEIKEHTDTLLSIYRRINELNF